MPDFRTPPHPPTLGASGGAGFDTLVVGAGFSGCVLAERLATQNGQRVLVLDTRAHIGGNAYDRYDDAGVLVHPYGPHIFHTNSADVVAYLSQFTAWRPYQHRVLASVDGQLLPMPINLDTVNRMYGLQLTTFEMDGFLASVAEKTDPVRTSEDVVVNRVGRELYNEFFRGYTRKQWGLDPSELDASVTARVPTRTNRDDRYVTDTYQQMPLHGYTRMFERMLAHPRIQVMLNTDFRDVAALLPWRHMVDSGPIDAFFDHRNGRLPYRSLDFAHVTQHPEADAEQCPHVSFVGRLASYKYYNMDQVVAQALATHKRMAVAGLAVAGV